MEHRASRKSWDTNIKHYYRLGLEGNLPFWLNGQIPSSNKSRWRHEPKDKYSGCEIAGFIEGELELIKRIGQNSRIKKLNEGYFKLADTFHEIISNVKGIKTILKQQKELIVNTVESVKVQNSVKVYH